MTRICMYHTAEVPYSSVSAWASPDSWLHQKRIVNSGEMASIHQMSVSQICMVMPVPQMAAGSESWHLHLGSMYTDCKSEMLVCLV